MPPPLPVKTASFRPFSPSQQPCHRVFLQLMSLVTESVVSLVENWTRFPLSSLGAHLPDSSLRWDSLILKDVQGPSCGDLWRLEDSTPFVAADFSSGLASPA